MWGRSVWWLGGRGNRSPRYGQNESSICCLGSLCKNKNTANEIYIVIIITNIPCSNTTVSIYNGMYNTCIFFSCLPSLFYFFNIDCLFSLIFLPTPEQKRYIHVYLVYNICTHILFSTLLTDKFISYQLVDSCISFCTAHS